MEGVSFALRNNIETIESLGIRIDEIRAVGGGLKSPAWLEALGKITRKPVVTVSVPDTANLGNILFVRQGARDIQRLRCCGQPYGDHWENCGF
jgi:xylulokinase